MKYFKTVIVLLSFFSSFSMNAFALPLAFRAVGFVASRAFALVKNARPLAQQAKNYLQNSKPLNQAAHKALCISEPYITKAEIWALEYPKEAAAGIAGGLIGWETSDKGIVNTVTGVVTGAVTGLALSGYSGMRVAYEAALAEAGFAKKALGVVEASHQATLMELQAAQAGNTALTREVAGIKSKYEKACAQLAVLKSAARSQSVKRQKEESSSLFESWKMLV